MSMFEFFTGGMPLFFPSKKLFIENDYKLQSVSAYWGSELPNELKLFSDMNKWLDLADFYHVFKSPNVYVYESTQHLIDLMNEFQWKDDKEILDNYKSNIRNTWLTLLKPVFDL